MKILEGKLLLSVISAIVLAAVWMRPALIDIGLPGMDGCELAQRLRAHEATAPITLVAVTGYGRLEDRKRIQDAGFQAHLIKPVEDERLRQIIATVPRRSRAS